MKSHWTVLVSRRTWTDAMRTTMRMRMRNHLLVPQPLKGRERQEPEENRRLGSSLTYLAVLASIDTALPLCANRQSEAPSRCDRLIVIAA